MKPICGSCGSTFSTARRRAGYHLCMPCGEDRAQSDRRSWTVAPMHKSNYMLITDRADLRGINNKGGLYK